MEATKKTNEKDEMMAKYDITHSCGHEVTHNIVGKVSQRDSKAEWLAKDLCSDCYIANQAEIAAKANADLPSLSGSDKQIAWAEQLRAAEMDRFVSFERDYMRYIDQAATNPANADRIKIAKQCLQSMRDDLTGHTESRWWIDNRDECVNYKTQIITQLRAAV